MKILDKIQKLLKLAESPNEHEATLAMEKAHALLAEHNVTMAEVAAHNNDVGVEEVGHGTHTTNAGATWVRQLWMSTAKLYFCDYFFSSGNHKTYHTIIGTKANSATAMHMAEYLTGTVLRLSNEAGWGQPGKFKSNFRQGCALRLARRMREMRELAEAPTSTGTNLPAVYNQTQVANEAYTAANFNIRSTKARAIKISDSGGYLAGKIAGDKISLNDQVSGTTKQKELT